jgi:hypothetical protein
VSEITSLGRVLILVGALFMLIGLGLAFAPRIPFLGRLPGDLLFRRGGVTVYVPLATCLLASLLLTIVLSLLKR